MSIVLVTSVLSLGCSRPVVLPGHRFELCLADSVARDGLVSAVMRSSGDEVFLDSANIAVSSDFEKIWITTDARGRPAISFIVSDSAAQKLSSITAANSGKMIALVVNGVPETAIPIASPFSKTFQVTGDFSESETLRFYQAVTGYDRP